MAALKTRTFFIFSLFFMALCCTISMSAHADDVKYKQLTEDNVRAFIEKTSEMTSGNNLDFSSEEITSYLQEHLHKKARFKSTMKYNIPGFPTKSSAMSLDKKEFIESVNKGADSVSDYENHIEIEDIKISSKKDKATVRTKGYESGVMPVSMDGESTEFANIEGESACVQIISLEDGVIQMYNANCTTVIQFSEY